MSASPLLFQRLFPVALMACMTFVLAAPAVGSTTTVTYMRPSSDVKQEWSVVGASTAWDALNDNVTEASTPTSTDYITPKGFGYKQSRVYLGDINLPPGGEITSATAWYYTGNSAGVSTQVYSGGKLLTFFSSSSSGWHSSPLTLGAPPKEITNAQLEFYGAESFGKSPQVYAAFIKVIVNVPSPIYWGAWIDGDVYQEEEPSLGDAPWDETTWSLFEEHTNRSVSIVHFGQPPPWEQAFASTPLELTRKRGAIPLMDMGLGGATLKEVANGSYDSDLEKWAAAVKKFGFPLFFRWAWEMNGTWFPWGKEAASNPKSYVDAWKHFHDIAESAGATNLTWVWCPNAIFEGSTSLSSLFPGESYVDWTCMDAYNFGGSSWTSFASLVSPTYSSLLSLAPKKPIMIGETASAESGGSKAGWISDALLKSIPETFPAIEAFNWFNWNITEEATERDWPIESSSSSESAFRAAISTPYYASNEFGGLEPLARIKPIP